MQIVAPLVILASLVSSALADAKCTRPNARTQPPTGAIVVDATGAHPGSFKTVTEGVAHLPNTTAEHSLFGFPGVYEEQAMVPKLNGPLVVQGYTCNTESYADNQVTITHKMAQKDVPTSIKVERNSVTSTLGFKTGSVKIYNLNVANPEPKINQLGQSIALFVNTTTSGFYGCNVTGYQDTMYANTGRQRYTKSYISGAVDFIFGQLSKVWFENCDIESIGNGAITANGNLNSSNLSECRRPEGWQSWNGDNNTANVYFKEFKNSGPAAATDKRVSFSGQLDAPVAMTEILGDDYKSQWFVDSKFL
ncbi:hypothetical protein PHYSODRAFT_260992 [Phytophthora sojae]|uniref:Pectinesterase n=1 Tax=Phytophthora sojae (strain P6497) TaxID=1094619 RepID=G5A1G6_PHYSP|nr:hypothetical protein PHYSODRAFT_260992 [Phytophthora sojae]EGZ10764.1 hypothetical protein PHYSODRAFT_260992 [Phytophthora sojae]|eukprot:XP_009533509.1 hypothetical protein PHYSODRAFT_260992 [Phytophthora sojae]